MQANPVLFKQQVWEAVVQGSVLALESVIWEIITAEVHSGRCCFRKALLQALDGSDFATEAHRNELLQRFAAQSGAGDTDAQCFIGILLCFQGGHEGTEFVMPAHGVKFLHAAAERHNNLATLLLALCFECGKGVEVSTDAAKQCYNMAATRGYQMAQIFLKELVRDTTFASRQQAAAAQQQQAANLGGLNPLADLGSGPGGSLHPALRGGGGGGTGGYINQPMQYNAAQQLRHAGGHAGVGLGQPNLALLSNFIGGSGSSQQMAVHDLIEQQIAVAKQKLRTAVQERDVVALVSAVEWGQELCNTTGRQIQELGEARSILQYCREHQRFPEFQAPPPQRDAPSRADSPAPSHRSAAPSTAGEATAASPRSQVDSRAALGRNGAPENGNQSSHAVGNSSEPTPAERGDAFFQQARPTAISSASEGTDELGVPFEPLEQNVNRTPSEPPPPNETALDEFATDSTPPNARPALRSPVEQGQSPAVPIPRRGTSSHGSIGDRRALGGGGSVAESDPPLTHEALDLFNLTSSAGSRSAPNSHADAFDRLSVGSPSSLPPNPKLPLSGEAGGESGKPEPEREASPIDGRQVGRSASTRAPSPAPSVAEEAVRRTQSALGGRQGGDGRQGGAPSDPLGGLDMGALQLDGAPAGDEIDVRRLVSERDLEILAAKGVSIADLQTAFSSTTDPQKLEAYARGIRQMLESDPGRDAQALDGQPQGPALTAPVASPFGAVAGQHAPASAAPPTGPPGSAAGQPPQEDWGKLMQALHGSVTGLEGEPLNDYLHNLRMLCSEDPSNDMVMPPTQSIPGIEAVLGALQAQGTPPQQQQEIMRLAAAAAARGQAAPGQYAGQIRAPAPGLSLQALGQQPQGQQRLGQGLPIHLQGLGNDISNRYPGNYTSLAGANRSFAGSSPLMFNQAQANMNYRQFNQPLAGAVAYGQPGAQDLSSLLSPNNNQALASRLQANAARARTAAGAGMAASQLAQPRPLGPQGAMPPNYEQLWGMYGSKAAAAGAAPGLLGAQAVAKGNANRFAPSIPAKPLPSDLQRSMLTQGQLANNSLQLGMANLGPAGVSNPWNAAALGQAGRLAGMQPPPNHLLGSQGLSYPGSYPGSGPGGHQLSQSLALGTGFGLAGPTNQAAGIGSGQSHPSSASLQSLRLSASQTPQPIGPPSASQAAKTEAAPVASSTYTLFKAPSAASLPGGQAANGQSLQSSPSQQTLADNLWSMTSQPLQPGPPQPQVGGAEGGVPNKPPASAGLPAGLGAQAEQPSEQISASMGILSKEAEMHARMRTWAPNGPTPALVGFNPQASDTVTGWNPLEASQLAGKGQARSLAHSSAGIDDSFAHALRAKPPQQQSFAQHQFGGLPRGPGGLSQGSLSSGVGADAYRLNPGFAGLGGMGVQPSAGLGQSLSSGMSGSPAASNGMVGARLPTLLGQPRPNRFPG